MFKFILIFTIFHSTSIAEEKNRPLNDKLQSRRQKANQKRPDKVKKVMESQNMDLLKSGILDTAIKKGVSVPNFSLEGKKISDFYRNKNIILKFYRGGWCPYCMIELKEYQGLYNRIKKSGCDLIGIAPDTKKEILKTKKRHFLEFPIYSDQDNKIAKMFGIAFTLNNDLVSVYEKFGIDLKKSQGNSSNQLPLPGTYVVNRKGKIIYAFADIDYTKRAEPTEVLSYCFQK